MSNPTRTYQKSAPTMQEFIVMCAIRQSGGEFVDVTTVLSILRRRAQLDLQPTVAYTLLKRLEKDGYVFMVEQPAPRGESRHFYSLTTEGYAFLTEWYGKLSAML